MRPSTASRRVLAALAAAMLGASLSLPAAGAVGPGGTLTPAERQALRAGIQLAPKGAPAPKGAAVQPNPYLADVPDIAKVDYSRWRQKMAAAGRARAASARLADNRRRAAGVTTALPPPFVHDEQEPAGSAGSNDTVANAERIPEFGVGGTGNPRVRILGSLTSTAVDTRDLAPVPEDNGSIPLAGRTRIFGTGAIQTTGVVGDGPHGSSGDGTGDFDFYRLQVDPGLSVVADTTGSDVDTVVALYDARGTLLATDDDGGPGLTSLLSFAVPRAGTYYLAVAGFRFDGPLPGNPFDSGSGPGVGEEGAYALSLAAKQVDRDLYSVHLHPGDVIGGVGTGAATGLTVWKSDGSQRVGARGLDASSLYAPESPLPGGGNTTFAFVAEQSAWYSVEVTGPVDESYGVTIEGYRPGAQVDRPRVKQTVFLDFDGQRVNGAVWGGPGVADLSPFSAFIGRWGLSKAQEGQLVDRITAVVRENIATDLQRTGLNPFLQVRVTNSRTSPDTFGRDNVARVVVGGTVAQLGIDTIGIAQYIDPGNYGLEDQAVVLLDVLSERRGTFGDPSLNTYLKAGSNRVEFVSQALGNVISHEIGHLIGSYHTDNLDAVPNLMDAGGTGFETLFGVGPDRVGGTADDADVDFTTDTYMPPEGFTGTENTANVSSWGFWFR